MLQLMMYRVPSEEGNVEVFGAMHFSLVVHFLLQVPSSRKKEPNQYKYGELKGTYRM